MCFTLEHEPLKETDDQSEQLRKHLNHGFVRPRMWAQYADNHKGVCSWFDGNKLDENLNKELGKRCEIFRGNVLYNVGVGLVIPPLPRTIIDDIQNLGEKGAARKYIFDHYKEFFLRKNTDWESEWEYRWLVHSERRSPEYVSICGAIKGIIVGVDFPKVYEPSLRLLCEDLGISAGRVNWENGVANVDLESICKSKNLF